MPSTEDNGIDCENDEIIAENDVNDDDFITNNQETDNKPSKFDVNLSFATLRDIHTYFSEQGSGNYDPFIATVLQGVGLDSEVPKFKNNNIDMLTFLNMNDDDLKIIGVQLSTNRAKIIEGIRRFIKQEWKESALPSRSDQQSSSADAVNLMSNITNQFQVLSASLTFLKTEFDKGLKILPMQDDFQYSTVLLLTIQRCQVLNELIELELDELSKKALAMRQIDGFAEADFISKWKPKTKKSNKTRTARIVVGVGVLSVVVFGVMKLIKFR